MPCPLCDDSGWKPVERDGRRMVTRCDCWRDTLALRLLADARLPRRYQHCSLDGFVTYGNESLQRAVTAAKAMVDKFPTVDRGLFLLGPPGVGKTHIAVATLKAIVERKRVTALFYDTRALLRAVRQTYDASEAATESTVLRPILACDLLVLDDLGAEKSTEWVEETLNLIVNHRYSERRTTIFTSNYDDKPDISDPDSLLCRIGYRMRSRLHEMCEFVNLDGADYRELPPNGDVDDLRMMWQQRKQQPAKTHALPSRANPARAQLRPSEQGDGQLKWSGGRAGT